MHVILQIAIMLSTGKLELFYFALFLKWKNIHIQGSFSITFQQKTRLCLYVSSIKVICSLWEPIITTLPKICRLLNIRGMITLWYLYLKNRRSFQKKG